MSTRCTINFCYPDNDRPDAKVYRHCDGYPERRGGVLASLDRFFADVEKATRDTRFDDPTYLAAKFVVWQMGGSLDCLGCGVCIEDPGDIAYTYDVICHNDGKRPEVRAFDLGADDERIAWKPEKS